MTPPLIALLMAWLTWRGSFVVLGLVSLVWGVVWAWYFRNEPKDHAAITEAELAHAAAASDGRAASGAVVSAAAAACGRSR